MTAVDTTVREFSISFYQPSTFNTIFLCAALVALLVAGTWFGMRLYLHLFGVKTDGQVIEARVKSSMVKTEEFSPTRFLYTSRMKIEYTGPDGVKRTVKGTSYSREMGGNDEVQVLYSRSHPGFAMYYDPGWHYIVPVASLIASLLLVYAAAFNCHENIRTMNVLSLGDSMREHFDDYQKVIIESNFTINNNPQDAAAYERRGDAQFAIVQFRDAIEDYSAALRLRPGDRDLLLKRAKAEWLEGRDGDALRDWRQSRH
jgi:hypothetical protein